MVTMSSDDACKVLSAMPGRYLEHRKCYLSLLLLFLLLLLLSGSSEREHLSWVMKDNWELAWRKLARSQGQRTAQLQGASFPL